MEILFILITVFAVVIFILTFIIMLSPKAQGKWLSKQIKATKSMLDYSKEDLKDLAKMTSNFSNEVENEILDENEEILKDNARKRANIKKEEIKITAKAIKEGLTSDKNFCKYCGKLIDNDSKFCKHCGKEL